MNNNSDIERSRAFDDKINNLGRITSIISLALMISVPLAVTIFYKIQINIAEIAAAAGGLIAMFAPMAIVENISYYPLIGAGGVYLSCITGNIMNMKLPSALSGMKLAGVEPGSAEGDIISIICIGVSSFVTVTILMLSMFIIGKYITPYLSRPILQPAFANIMPALLGALVTPFVLKSLKVSVVPFALSIALCLALGGKFVQRYGSYFLPLIMLASVFAAYCMYKRGMLAMKPARQGGTK
ncbi:MAG: hypothetical protein LBS45_02835 [Synergistaceae bacterium]|jgi:hypothetical protein|nr:hypothetical protein [Synergistaceae bacterium]